MGIVMTTPPNQIDQYLNDQIDRRERAIINALEYVGTQCQNEARTGKTYKDVTGNLISSVGYVVLKDGVSVSGGGGGNAELEKQSAKHQKGIALIVVAGMNYAAAVEARNFNVLTSAELLAEQLVPQLLKQLGFTVK